jgi:glycerophosphoryl diester phosphodiesterase
MTHKSWSNQASPPSPRIASRAMPVRRIPPIAFAHRGARAHAPENTLEAFRLARRLGATGLESDVWVTADGEAVLDHDGVVKTALRKREIRDVRRSQLPSHVPTLAELYTECGTEFELSLDLKDPAALGAVLHVTRSFGAESRLWLCDHQWERLAGWRSLASDIKLVDSTRLKRLKEGPERHGANLAAARIDAINMHYSDWNAGLTTLFHRFDLHVFGWDAQHERVLKDLLSWQIDGVYCDDVERMMSVVAPPAIPL